MSRIRLTTMLSLLMGIWTTSDWSVAAESPTTTTLEFLNQDAGLKALYEGDRLVAIYGTPMLSETNTTVPTNTLVNAFVHDNPGKFGVDGVEISADPDSVHVIRDGKYTVFTYHQEVTCATNEDTLPVHNSSLKVPVLHLPDGSRKIAYVGVRLVTPPADFPSDTVNIIDATNTVEVMSEYAGMTFSTPEKVVYKSGAGEVHRAWRFTGTEGHNMVLFFVSAFDGSLIHASSLSAHGVVSGTVSGFATNRSTEFPDGPTNDPIEYALSDLYMRLYENPPNSCPNYGGTLVGEDTTDLNGVFEFDPLAEPLPDLQLFAALEGPWVKVTNFQASGNLGECDDEIENHPTASAVQFNSPFLGYPARQYDTAQVNCFLAFNAAHKFITDLQPYFEGVDTQAECIVNVGSACPGAFTAPLYSPPLSYFYPGSGSCGNSAMPSLVTHEYMHIIQGALWGNSFYDEPRFSEATADAFAAYVLGSSLIGYGTNIPNGATRDLDYSNIAFTPTCNPPPNCPGYCPVLGCSGNNDVNYCCSLALSGALWDMRTALLDANVTVDDVNKLIADFMFISDGSWDQSLLAEMLVADDDDGNLSTPTTRSPLIIGAFLQHGFVFSPPGDDGSVRVEWEGPDPESIQPGVDYFVYWNVEPPIVILKTTVDETGAVDVWDVGRVDPNSPPEFPNALDLGAVLADWSAPADHNVIVNVGGPVTPCQSVNIVDIPAQSNNNWSSIVLILEDDSATAEVVEGNLGMRAAARSVMGTCQGGENQGAPCRSNSDCPSGTCILPANFGAGGRISGTIAGTAGAIDAEAIGQADGAGLTTVSLNIGGDFSGGVFRSFPATATLEAGVLKSPLYIEENLDGALTFKNCTSQQGAPGLLHVAGGGTGEITIENSGAVDNEQIQIRIDGDYGGTLKIDRLPAASSIQTGALSGTIDVLSAQTPIQGMIEIGSTSQSGDVEAGGLIDMKSKLGAFGAIKIHGNVDAGALIKAQQGIDVNGVITVDNGLAGTLEIGATAEPDPIVGDVTGDILIGGQLSGTVQHQGRVLREENYVGTIDVQSIATGGRYIQPFFDPDPEHTWDGELLVHGDVNGTIDVRSGLGPDALVSVSGTLGQPGRIKLKQGLRIDSLLEVDGNVAGNIEIGVSTENPPSVGDVLGEIQIGGQLAGNIIHFGTTAASGMFDIGSVLATGKYTQTFNNPLAEWGGMLMVGGSMAGTLSFQTKLRYADVLVTGAMSGTIKTGEMYNSSIALNTVGYCSASTSGSILIGNKTTSWVTTHPGSGIVNLGNIDVWGDFTSTAVLKISKYQPTEPISAFGTVCYHRHMYGQEQVGVLNGTPPAILHCPAMQDPCCPGC